MLRITLAALAAIAFITPAQARPPLEGQLATHGHYINVSGHQVHRPSRSVSGRMPTGASAHCRDGSWSFSEHHQGTCSHHGGVADWE